MTVNSLLSLGADAQRQRGHANQRGKRFAKRGAVFPRYPACPAVLTCKLPQVFPVRILGPKDAAHNACSTDGNLQRAAGDWA